MSAKAFSLRLSSLEDKKPRFISRDVAAVADKPHKLGVVGSNPTPATNCLGFQFKESTSFVIMEIITNAYRIMEIIISEPVFAE